MRVHVLQHVPFEGLGSIEPWLTDQRADVVFTRLYASDRLPAPDTADLVIALGGPMSVNDEREWPWLRAEKAFLATAIASGTSVLGICLGAQLIASSQGARVFQNSSKEIGWFPVHAEPSTDDVFRFPPSLDVFHWHGETFDLPRGARHLARSAGCQHQAFQLGRGVLGLQFHLETTPRSADALISNCRRELVPQRYVQSEDELRRVPASAYEQINAVMNRVLEYLTRGEESGGG